MNTQDILLIIGAITTMACSIIAAFKTATVGRKLDGAKLHLEKQDEKKLQLLETIHTQTNGNLAAVQSQLEAARREIAELKAAREAKAEAASELAAQVSRHLQAVAVSARRPSLRKGSRRGSK